jgi:hypothetical protein
MGMGSPDNRRKADDSCRALCVGRSLSKFLRDKQLVRFVMRGPTGRRTIMKL